jgi:GNAT superfamily N-acetyltransferase
VTLRALVPEDRDLVSAVFDRLSPRSRFLRFHSPVPRLTGGMLDALVDVDHQRHVALVALHEGVAIGVVRYVRDADDPSVAEFAITVVDDYHGLGLGRALTDRLTDLAAARGVRTFVMEILSENRAMLALVRSLGTRAVAADGAMRARVPVERHAGVVSAAAA